jgi:branched-chain amino acid transport system ATP-binding protein
MKGTAEGVLTAEDVRAGYGGEDVVRGASIAVSRSEIVVLLGPNGAGKSTLMKAIMGLVPRSAGRVTIRGTDVSSWPTGKLVREGIAYVPQTSNVFPALSVTENLELGGYVLRRGLKGQVDAMLDLFPALRSAVNRPAGTLSGGERSLLALAGGLMSKPAVLLADEPTAGLSPANELVVWEHLSLISQAGISVLVVEQNVNRALAHSDAAYVLILGTIKLREASAALLHSDRLSALYLGLDAANPRAVPQPPIESAVKSDSH